MENVIEGRIVQVCPEESGTSKSGNAWRKQTAVLETIETYPRKIAFQMFNDKIVPLRQGQNVKVSINIESREWNGRWYTDINAWKIESEFQMQAPQAQQMPQQAQAPHGEPNDLPF